MPGHGSHRMPLGPALARSTIPACRCCRDRATVCDKKGWLCLDCALELYQGVIPDMQLITSKSFHVPAGCELTRKGRRPGCGEGNDYFGNHT